MNKVDVYYKKVLAGTLERKVEGTFIFVYDELYLASTHPSLSLTLPKSEKVFYGQNLFPFFDGLIPEGWLLNLAINELRLDPLKDRFDLLSRLCRNTIGAIHIGPKDEIEKAHHGQRVSKETKVPKFDRCLICYGDHTSIYHDECMKKVFGTPIHPMVELDDEIIDVLAKNQLNQRLAIPGVQKKLSLDLEKDKDSKDARITFTDLWGRFIFKPRGNAPHLPENEHLCIRLAEQAGIEVEKCALVPTSHGHLGFIAARFDRGPKYEEYHQEDFCQVLGKEPYKKYQGSFEQIGKILKTKTSFPGDNLYRLLELMMFNFIIGNADFHLKNLSLCFETAKGMKTILTPAYDLLSTDLYIFDDNEQSALAINGKKNQLKRMDFIEAAKSFDIPEKVFDGILLRFDKNLNGWNEIIDRSFIGDQEKLKFKKLIADRLIILQKRMEEKKSF